MVDLIINGPITVIVKDDDEGTRAALARIETMLFSINRKARQSNVNEAESLALLGEINATSTEDSQKLDTVVASLSEAQTDIDALIALAQRPDVPPELASGLTALKDSLSGNSTKVGEVASRAAALASAYTPPETPTTPPGEVPGETVPPSDGSGDGSTDGGTGDVTGTGDGTIPAGGANT